jgi:hypothetical protein
MEPENSLLNLQEFNIGLHPEAYECSSHVLIPYL